MQADDFPQLFVIPGGDAPILTKHHLCFTSRNIIGVKIQCADCIKHKKQISRKTEVGVLGQFCAEINIPQFPFLDLKVLEAICLKSKHSFRQFSLYAT